MMNNYAENTHIKGQLIKKYYQSYKIEVSHRQFLVISLHKYISSLIQNQQNDNVTI